MVETDSESAGTPGQILRDELLTRELYPDAATRFAWYVLRPLRELLGAAQSDRVLVTANPDGLRERAAGVQIDVPGVGAGVLEFDALVDGVRLRAAVTHRGLGLRPLTMSLERVRWDLVVAETFVALAVREVVSAIFVHNSGERGRTGT